MGVALDVEQAFDVEQPKDVEQAQRGGTEERSAILFSALEKMGVAVDVEPAFDVEQPKDVEQPNEVEQRKDQQYFSMQQRVSP